MADKRLLPVIWTTITNFNYWPALKVEVDAILLQDTSIKEGKMFGYPGIRNKKLSNLAQVFS